MRFTTLIVRNLLRRGVRTALTVVGLAVGVSAVVALLGIAWGFERSFMTIYESKGIDLVVVRAGSSDRLSSNLDARLADQIRRVPGVKDVVGSLTDVTSFESANLLSVLINGWQPDSLLFKGIRLLNGRTLRRDDARVAVLGRVLAINLGKKTGDSVDVSGEEFRVVGVYESDSLFENGGLIVPLKELQRMTGRAGYVSGFVVSADSPDHAGVGATAKRIETSVAGVAALPARDFVTGDIQIRLVKAMAWATSVIATALGSIGVLNTMMMTVFERTREIGVFRALGWRRSRVLGLVLGEAAMLGAAGSLLGVAMAALSVKLIARSSMGSLFINENLPPGVLGIGLLLGLSLSLVGGLYPAFRAAGLDPTEALRHD